MGSAGKSLIVYKSVHHRNTARVAGQMAGVLGADACSPAECPRGRLAGVDLLGIGSGVYYGRVHDELWRWVRDLPEAHSGRPRVFIFTTSGLPFLARVWHWPLKRVLAEKGYEVSGEFACRGFDTWGPLWLTGGLNRSHPDERDLRRAREFAARVAAQAVGAGREPAPRSTMPRRRHAG